MFSSGGTLRIILIFLTQMCTKRLVNMCGKFWESFDRFLIDGLRVN